MQNLASSTIDIGDLQWHWTA